MTRIVIDMYEQPPPISLNMHTTICMHRRRVWSSEPDLNLPPYLLIWDPRSRGESGYADLSAS